MFCLPDNISDGPSGDRGYAIRESIGHVVEKQNVKAVFGLSDPTEEDGEPASVPDASSSRFFTWALGTSPHAISKGDHIRACAEMNLEALSKRAKASDRNTITRLSQVQTSRKFRSPRPPGYAAATWLHVLGAKVIALCDYGATSSGISEELACLLISYCNAEIAKGNLEPKDSPIWSVECYDSPSSLQGVGGPSMATTHAVVINCEFIGIGKRTMGATYYSRDRKSSM